jgi:sulfur carrier protein ThiS
MHITVEFNGLAEMIAGTRQTQIEVGEDTTYQDVVERLVELYPDMVNSLIRPEDHLLLSSTVFVRNGQDLITYEQMHERLSPGDRLALLTVIVGG